MTDQAARGELASRFYARAAERDQDRDAGSANAWRVAAHELEAAPLAERAPEVGQLLAAIWEVAEGESWPGGDTVSVLCEWFTRHGYDIDAPITRGCEACDAEPGEECAPDCIGQAAELDRLGVDLTADEAGACWLHPHGECPATYPAGTCPGYAAPTESGAAPQ